MTRKASLVTLFVAAIAVLGIAAGLGVWLVSPSRAPAQGNPTTAQPAPATFAFMPLDKPRPLPELRFIDAERHDLTAANFRGKLVLLNIWATWCVPCRQEMPSLDRLQARLDGADFKVVAVSIDRQGLAAVKPFYAELGLKALGIYVDAWSKIIDALGVVGLPTSLLVNQAGEEIGRVVGPVEWDSPEVEAMIRKYLKRKNPDLKEDAR